MIISHKHRFIYVKTRKTASTSLEIALSKFCGPDDIITPIDERGEAKRRERGYRGPQNFYVPLKYYDRFDWATLLLRQRRKEFYNHRTADFIQDHVEPGIWDSYYTFSFERNPFDKAVSFYYYKTNEPRPNFNTWIHECRESRLTNWPIYTINGHMALDHLARYENLEAELAHLRDAIGLPDDIELPKAKSGFRPERSPYTELMDDAARERIELVCAREIRLMGYSFGD
ncbi:hypothetical protein CRI94_08760 [Longibacter salinarum]|uniref:Chondroitin 4-O-sulfotransferase n=1 Tax=Longibacter salinarum TaxID=1850348 RepID=A0A2A8CXI0_9BACT|nr:sulfotransferase family 2 domain-containing protein [Longibacter salinarum]PEN13405.1 hypothetical protein CRI94_08760 [Longibacter salinarum]